LSSVWKDFVYFGEYAVDGLCLKRWVSEDCGDSIGEFDVVKVTYDYFPFGADAGDFREVGVYFASDLGHVVWNGA
jgi:hypothetical protein